MDTRPVWLTRHERESLEHYWPSLKKLCDRWDAAPADPREVTARAIWDSTRESDDEGTWDDEQAEWIKQAYRDHEASAVLRALGMPCPD